MKLIIDQWIDHYATVTNGESALFRENLLQACHIYNVAEPSFCNAFAAAVAEAFIAGRLDADRASFAINDLFWSADCALNGFALKVFDALEYRESTICDVQELMSTHAAGHAA